MIVCRNNNNNNNIIIIIIITCFIARCFVTDRVTTTGNNVVRHWTLTTGLAPLLGFTEFYSNRTRKSL